MPEVFETAVEHMSGDDYITYTVAERKWLNKLLRQMEQYPDLVDVRATNPDGSMVVRLPYSWFKAPAPPKQINMTEEQRRATAERLREARESKNS